MNVDDKLQRARFWGDDERASWPCSTRCVRLRAIRAIALGFACGLRWRLKTIELWKLAGRAVGADVIALFLLPIDAPNQVSGAHPY